MLHIDGMTCGSCAEHVKQALEKVPGVRSASVSYPQRRAEIEASVGTVADVTSLVAAVSALGYRAQAVDARSWLGSDGMKREGGDPAEEENDSINGFGASLAYSYEQDECGFNAGIGWVSNLADAGTITDYLEEKGIFAVADQAPGLSLNLGARYNAFALLTEYVTALDHFTLDELPYGVSEAEPSAWNSELAYTATIMDKETVFAVGYQKSWEASALELPEHRYLVAASIGLFEGTTLAFEYYYDKDYSISDGGTDNNGNGFTTRLG